LIIPGSGMIIYAETGRTKFASQHCWVNNNHKKNGLWFKDHFYYLKYKFIQLSLTIFHNLSWSIFNCSATKS
jgi:hypothetical protein